MPDNTAKAAPANLIETDICVIGGGAGGLAAALQAVAFGQRVVLIERHKLGGDSLNYGSVPARYLAKVAADIAALRNGAGSGLIAGTPAVDHDAITSGLRAATAKLASTASSERLRGLGIRVLQASARFIDRETVAAGEDHVRARRFIIATGSSPKIPQIEGLAAIPYLTSETLYAQSRPIEHLGVIGGGATGLSIAQTYQRLGTRVTVLERDYVLNDEEREFAEPLAATLALEGVSIHEGFDIRSLGSMSNTIRIDAQSAGLSLTCSHIVVACGRKPSIHGLGLSEGGVAYTPSGITVNAGLRTSNAKIYAIGDATGVSAGAHQARADAELVLRHILFRQPVQARGRAIPRVTWTDPGIAHVGLNEAEARKSHQDVHVLRWSLSETDISTIQGATTGHIKIVTDRRGRVLGASILARDAAEQMGLWSLAVACKTPIGKIAGLTPPYPTIAEAGVRGAQTAFSGLPGNPIIRKLIALLAKLG